MSMTVATSSRASSLLPLKSGEQKESSATAWTTAMFSFPPPNPHTPRALAVPRKRSKSRESRTSQSVSSCSSSTSRIINNLPGFDAFADLVISSERATPRLTITPANEHSSPRTSRSRRTHPHRSKPSEPKSTVPVVPAQTSLPWSEDDNDAGRVTFIFGRFRPSMVRRSAPAIPDNQICSKDFVNIPSPQEQPTLHS